MTRAKTGMRTIYGIPITFMIAMSRRTYRIGGERLGISEGTVRKGVKGA